MSDRPSYARANFHRFQEWPPHDAQHVAAVLSQQVMTWISRHRQRRALADVAADDHLLQDLGISRGDALREAGKSFWK